MAMGSQGMGAMAEMAMKLPDNTLPMMTSDGPFGSVEMGGMLTVMKVRPGIAADDYRDPGWFKHPEGSVAFEWKGEPPPTAPQAPTALPKKRADFQVIDPRKRPFRTASQEH